MSEPDNLLESLLPRLTQLSGVLNRARLLDHAMAAAGLTVDRPALGVLAELPRPGDRCGSGRSRRACRSSDRTSPGW
jgi:hypothetical protein